MFNSQYMYYIHCKSRDICFLVMKHIKASLYVLCISLTNIIIFLFRFQYLTEADYDAKKQQEIQTLEQTIQLQKQVC